jgi:hypothetical protein
LNNFNWLWNRNLLFFLNDSLGNSLFDLFALLCRHFLLNKFLWLLLIWFNRLTLLNNILFHLSLYIFWCLILINFLSILYFFFIVNFLFLKRFIIIYFFIITLWCSIKVLALLFLLSIIYWLSSILLLKVIILFSILKRLEFQSSINN